MRTISVNPARIGREIASAALTFAQLVLQPLRHPFEVPAAHRLEHARPPSTPASRRPKLRLASSPRLPSAEGAISKLHGEIELAAGHDSLAPVLDAAGSHRLAQLHRQVGMTTDLPDGDAIRKVKCVASCTDMLSKSGKQRREALRVRQQIEHFFRTAAGKKRSGMIHDAMLGRPSRLCDRGQRVS